jgi:hypothetical protein
MPAAMSCGPVIVAILRRPCRYRYSTAVRAPDSLSASTYGTAPMSDIGRPFSATGAPAATMLVGRGSSPCREIRMTPST